MTGVTKALAGLAIVGLAAAVPAAAQNMPKTATPKIFADVLSCRPIADTAQRLACYDRSVAALDTAQKSNELYVADREAMAEARRGLFGFSVPKLRIFNDDDMAKEVDSLETTIAAVRQGQRGYVFTLKDGARWAQTEKKYIDEPKAGATIRIRRALMGSYMASINGKPGFRIERLNN